LKVHMIISILMQDDDACLYERIITDAWEKQQHRKIFFPLS